MNDKSQNNNQALAPRNSGNTKFFIFNWIRELCGAVIKHPGLAYTVLVILGVTYSAAFFKPLGVPIFHLSSLPDFLLAGLRHSVTAFGAVLIVVAVALAVWLVILVMVFLFQIFLLVVGRTESKSKLDPLGGKMNDWLSGKTDSFLFWLILIVVLIAITVAKADLDRGFIKNYNAADGVAENAIHDLFPYGKWLMPISGVRVRLQLDGVVCAQDLLQLGSTTDFLMFSEIMASDPKKNWLVVPKSNILEILPKTTSPQKPRGLPKTCERAPGIAGTLGDINSTLTAIKELFGPENIDRLINAVEGHVTENELRVYIGKQMGCGAGQLHVSEFIRFPGNKSVIGDRGLAEIAGFADKYMPQKKWKVFGFASEEGDRELNYGLSCKRAVTVAKQLCSRLAPQHGPADIKCEGGPVQVVSRGESHFINGAANSRSAVIAACRGNPAESLPAPGQPGGGSSGAQREECRR